MNHDIFISYSRKDKEEVANIVNELESHGLSCWIDLIGIETGSQFEEDIINAIDDCKVFIFMISKNSITSEYTKDEVNYALNIKKKFAPVLLKGQFLPAKGWYRYKLGSINCIDYYQEEQRKHFIEDLIAWSKSLNSASQCMERDNVQSNHNPEPYVVTDEHDVERTQYNRPVEYKVEIEVEDNNKEQAQYNIPVDYEVEVVVDEPETEKTRYNIPAEKRAKTGNSDKVILPPIYREDEPARKLETQATADVEFQSGVQPPLIEPPIFSEDVIQQDHVDVNKMPPMPPKFPEDAIQQDHVDVNKMPAMPPKFPEDAIQQDHVDVNKMPATPPIFSEAPTSSNSAGKWFSNLWSKKNKKIRRNAIKPQAPNQQLTSVPSNGKGNIQPPVYQGPTRQEIRRKLLRGEKIVLEKQDNSEQKNPGISD